jgi:hypothetical protein
VIALKTGDAFVRAPSRMMEICMKCAVLFALIWPFALLGAAPATQLAAVHKVYVLPMSNGLDQYLANRLRDSGVVQVSADPANVDAVFTDRLGEAFEAHMDKLFPKPEPESETEETEAEAGAESAEKMEDAGVPPSSFRRGKGVVFLVDTKTRQVVWSIYDKPKELTADGLDATAGRIVHRLKRDLKQK